MARLTDTEKEQLLAATRDHSRSGEGGARTGGAVELERPVPMEVYFRQLQSLARLPAKPKPVAFEGAYWRL